MAIDLPLRRINGNGTSLTTSVPRTSFARSRQFRNHILAGFRGGNLTTNHIVRSFACRTITLR